MLDDISIRIHEKYAELLNQLEKASADLDKLCPENKKVEKYIGLFKDIIVQSINFSKKRIEDVSKCMVWDHLVIACFGSTNAGKSTLIETLRVLYDVNKTDEAGEIVGTGRPDFTERFDEYDLLIDGIKVTFIDMPGILSNEDRYTTQIHTALDKAHVILYVYREDTKPDVNTIEKIKSYLTDWVKVYTIYNISGFRYDLNNPLLDAKKLESEQLIKDEFSRALGETYKGNISLQALMALSSIANFSGNRQDLIRKQKKLLTFFPDKEDMYKYSEFPTFVNFIKSKSTNISAEIIEANKQRLYSIVKSTRRNLKDALKHEENIQRDLPLELIRFKNDINRYFETAISDLNRRPHNIVDTNVDSLSDSCIKLINSSSKNLNESLNRKQEFYVNKIQQDAQKAIDNILARLSQDLDRRKEDLKSLHLNIKIDNVCNVGRTRIDFTDAVNVMNLNFGSGFDIFTKACEFGATGMGAGGGVGSLFGGIGSIPGAIGGGAIGFLGGLGKGVYDLAKGNGYKQRACDAIQDSMEQLKEDFQEKISQSISPTISKLKRKKSRVEKTIQTEITKIKDVTNLADTLYDNMVKFENILTTNNYGEI